LPRSSTREQRVQLSVNRSLPPAHRRPPGAFVTGQPAKHLSWVANNTAKLGLRHPGHPGLQCWTLLSTETYGRCAGQLRAQLEQAGSCCTMPRAALATPVPCLQTLGPVQAPFNLHCTSVPHIRLNSTFQTQIITPGKTRCRRRLSPRRWQSACSVTCSPR
jgi:hypothetical protein